MGIGWSVHKNGGWQGQLERVNRWYQRILTLYHNKRAIGIELEFEDLDLVFAFFQNCHQLREWVVISRDVSAEEMSDFIKQNVELQVCRDIANGTKHFHVTNASVDPEFSILRQGVPIDWYVISGKMYRMIDLAGACNNLWNKFLSDRHATSEHLYTGFSIFAKDILRRNVQEYHQNRNKLFELTDNDEKRRLNKKLALQKTRLVDDLSRILEGPFSFDREEREALLQEIGRSLDQDEQ